MSEKNNYTIVQRIATILFLFSVLLFYLSIWVDGYHIKFLITAFFTLFLALLVQSVITNAEKKDKD